MEDTILEIMSEEYREKCREKYREFMEIFTEFRILYCEFCAQWVTSWVPLMLLLLSCCSRATCLIVSRYVLQNHFWHSGEMQLGTMESGEIGWTARAAHI